MSRITITKDPGYNASANVDGRVLTGDVTLEGDQLKVGDQSFTIGSMRITAESKEEQAVTPQPAADHPSMVGRTSESTGGSAATAGGGAPVATTAATAGVGVTGGGATPAADGGNAPSTRSR
jgi:hypothetical protein